MTELNFNEFPPSADYEEWKKLVHKELGEKPFESIVWKNENGFEVQPYFVAAEKVLQVKSPKRWDLYQSASHQDDKELNAVLLQSLMGGSNAIGIDKDITSKSQLDVILNDVLIQYIATHFERVSQPLNVLSWWAEKCSAAELDTRTVRGSMFVNALDLSDAVLLEIAQFSKKHFSLFHPFCVDATMVHAKGGTASQEIAFALAAGNDLLHRLVSGGISVDDASAMVQFNFATSSSYFEQIAKYRVFRSLWKTIVQQYQPQQECSKTCFIHASTSAFLQTTKDYNNNLLRATTQAMSAILGGADSVHVIPHDLTHPAGNDSSLRLARNIQQLLMEESYLQQAVNAAEGAYYLEALQVKLGEVGWKQFQEMEAGGGIRSQWSSFEISLVASLQQKRNDIKEGKKIIVGVNKYQNKNEGLKAASDSETLTGFLEKE